MPLLLPAVLDRPCGSCQPRAFGFPVPEPNRAGLPEPHVKYVIVSALDYDLNVKINEVFTYVS